MSVKAKYKSILIVRDPMTKTPKVVAPWEVPAYRSAFGDENVQVLDGDVEVTLDELPDANEEFNRLRAVFGVESETKQSHIDIVYGRGQPGIKALEGAIKASASGDVEKAQSHADKSQGYSPDAEVKAARKEAYVDDAVDPLMDDVDLTETDAQLDAAAKAANTVADAANAAAVRQGAKPARK